MAEGVGTQADTTLGAGVSRKRSYQSFRESISGSLKKITKKPKLDETVGNESTFKYGNYNRYYGYRNENRQEDKRLTILKREWFENKSVLDIGSNVGHVSLWIGKNFHPEKIKGVDIDCELVKAAKKNIVHYIDDNYVSNLELSFNNDDINDSNISSETNKSVLVEKSDLLSDSEHLKASEVLGEAEEKSEMKEVGPSSDGKSDIKDIPEENYETKEVLPTEVLLEVLPTEEKQETKDVSPTEEKHETKDVSPTEGKDESKDALCTSDKKNVKGTNDKNDANDTSNDYKKIKEINKGLLERLAKNKMAKLNNVFPYNVSFILVSNVIFNYFLAFFETLHKVLLL